MKLEIETPVLILASESPRRKQLLEKAGINFIVVPSKISEDKYRSSDPKMHVKHLAQAKADHVAQQYPHSWVIGADSIVEIDGVILEKPDSMADARQMLYLLSGKTHYVHTGFSIICKKKSLYFSDVVTTAVLFKTLTEIEIEWYE